MEETSRRYLCLSGFPLKLIALFTMTLDHVAVALEMNFTVISGSWVDILITVFHAIGRLAFPIFLFLLAEGLRHTHNRGRYILRLTFMWAIVFAFSCVYTFGLGRYIMTQAFSDLLPLALFIYLIEHPKKGLRPLAILPIAYLAVSFFVRYMALHDVAYDDYAFMAAGYNLYGLLMFLGIYYAPQIAGFFLRLIAPDGFDLEAYKTTRDYRYAVNLVSALSVILVTLLFWGLSYIGSDGFLESGPADILNMGTQSYAVLAAVPIACYNGSRGYNAKWFQYGSYAYYPLHIVVIFGITYLFML